MYYFYIILSREILIISFSAVLDVYDLEQILELNDKTTEECLEFLVEEGYVELPRIKPLDFE